MSIYGTDKQRKAVSVMTDREKVMWSLARCSCGVPDACSDCCYDNWPPRICVQHLTNDALTLLKAQRQFMQWLARLVTHEDGDGAECEIICRRLREMGYVEKYKENGIEYWREVKQDEL